MNDKDFDLVMKRIIRALEEKGYNPFDQINGYLVFRDPAYITRHNNARDMMEMLDVETIWHYMKSKYKTQNLLGLSGNKKCD